MKKLYLRQSSLSYVGLFTQPAFSLWKRDGVEIIEEVYKLFLPFEVNLPDINLSFDLEDLEESSVSVSIDDFVDFTLKPTGVECEIEGLLNDRFERFLELLQMIDNWLRGSEVSFKYKLHFFEYGGHGRLDDGTAQDYLKAFGTRKLKSIDQNLANGIIFNWIDNQTGGRAHIEIDHSLDIPEGLFLRWLVMLGGGEIVYKEIGLRSVNVMRDVLAEVDLEIQEVA
jgi:hypothetical protein